jgi:hypothetical protein
MPRASSPNSVVVGTGGQLLVLVVKLSGDPSATQGLIEPFGREDG